VEFALLQVLEKGGTFALIAFCIYLIVRIEKIINRLAERIDKLEDELQTKYVTKEEVFADISGWRGDLRAIAEKIDEMRKEFFYLKGRYDELRGKQ
jgi:uncharacterized protein (UPF0335 family)